MTLPAGLMSAICFDPHHSKKPCKKKPSTNDQALTYVNAYPGNKVILRRICEFVCCGTTWQPRRKRKEMADIDWHIIGHITHEGKIRISGFSFGGDKLFDSPIDLDEMIDALAASHEIPPDLLLSVAGRKELTQLGATLSNAGSEVRDRLRDDKTKSEEVQRRDNDDENEPD
jgi:hypothetical protein